MLYQFRKNTIRLTLGLMTPNHGLLTRITVPDLNPSPPVEWVSKSNQKASWFLTNNSADDIEQMSTSS